MSKRKSTKIILFYLFFIVIDSCGQKKDLSLEYYDKAGVYLKNGEYTKADSLYTLSLKLTPDRNTYYNRAICKQKLGDKIGYCTDLGCASNLGDKEANALFWRSCGRKDTVYTNDKNQLVNKTNFVFKEVILTFLYNGNREYSKYNNKNELLVTYSIVNEDTLYKKTELLPEFPGGISNIETFIRQNVKIPSIICDAEIFGKVYISFRINKKGEVKDVILLKGLAGCKECDEEALKAVKIMPSWKPGTSSGKAVDFSYTLPINFTCRKK